MKKLTIDNMHELQPWIALAGYEDCNANVVTMLMWQYPYPFYFEVHAHFALVCFHIEAEDEKRTEINLESSRRLKKLLPLFRMRINVLIANNKSFMQPKDWIKELKSAEALQNVYLYFKEKNLLEKCTFLGSGMLQKLYPDYGKFDKATAQNVFMLFNSLLQDLANGINPEDEASVNENILTSRLLKVPNVIGEEVRVMDLVAVAEI